MKIRLIVRHTVKPKNPIRTVVKTVKYTANADGTVSTSSSKKVIQKTQEPQTTNTTTELPRNYVIQDV